MPRAYDSLRPASSPLRPRRPLRFVLLSGSEINRRGRRGRRERTRWAASKHYEPTARENYCVYFVLRYPTVEAASQLSAALMPAPESF